jgi:uncharacterized membrane protein HdeD (DUF308 family)
MQGIAKSMTSNWWLLVLQGILAVVFGVTAWVWPDLTVVTLVILFGAYAIAGGVMFLAAAYGAQKVGDSPWPFIFRGVLGIGTGVVVAVWPDISALALLYVVAAYAVVIGFFELATAIELRKLINNEWLLAIAGIASIAFGVLVAIYPGDGAVAIVWTIGVYAVFFGILLTALGFRLHGWGRQLTSASAKAAPSR